MCTIIFPIAYNICGNSYHCSTKIDFEQPLNQKMILINEELLGVLNALRLPFLQFGLLYIRL